MDSGPYQVCVVCLGNICRSPIAEVVLSAQVTEAGLGGRVGVESAGTAAYHLGKPMDARAAAALAAEGFDPSGHRARQFQAEWFSRFDMVLAMDEDNRRDLEALARKTGATATIRMFRSFDPDLEATDRSGSARSFDVEDPYYAGPEAFAETVRVVRRTGETIVRRLLDNGVL